ncbi:unnamed protein product [Mytilus coruscus]|uniref:Uncharacterized protein n=1 Tax=Mytilus coruscus TaxID=42192 RepID=A0A6J8EQB4_MYTCO|nr:unnamed protein product [Mytilus coruscus]
MQLSSHFTFSLFYTGAITGGVVGVIIIATAVITVIACRRSIEKKRKTKENSSGQFSAETHDEDYNQNIKEIPSQPTYGIDICTVRNTYAKVNKNKDKPKETKHSNLYADAYNGEYDHLNKFRKREIIHTENTYDSHESMRSMDDLTYDSSDFGRRQLDDNNDVYDHSFPTTGKDEEYDCSTNVMIKPMNENRIYMDNYSSLSIL